MVLAERWVLCVCVRVCVCVFILSAKAREYVFTGVGFETN